MKTGIRMLLLLAALAASACVSRAQSVDGRAAVQPPQRGIWDEPIRFSTKSKDACSMAVSGAGDYTRLRVSCRGPSVPGQAPSSGRSYYCDFQGKPNLCRAYSQNPRHYFTQVMWELRKLSHACQGPRIYRPQMCKKYPDEAHMSFLSVWPKTSTGTTTAATPAAPTTTTTTSTTSKPSKPSQDQRRPVVPAQAKPATPSKPAKPQPAKPQPQPVKPQGGSKAGSQPRKPTSKQGKTTTTTPRPTEVSETQASRLAAEYCWKSFHGFCSYFMGWLPN